MNSNLSFGSILKIRVVSMCSNILRNSGTYCQTFKPFQQLHVSMSWVVPEHTAEIKNRLNMFQCTGYFRNILSNLRTVPTLFSYIRPWEFPMSWGVPEHTLYVSERSLLYKAGKVRGTGTRAHWQGATSSQPSPDGVAGVISVVRCL